MDIESIRKRVKLQREHYETQMRDGLVREVENRNMLIEHIEYLEKELEKHKRVLKDVECKIDMYKHGNQP